MESTKDFSAYATKAISPTMEAFADFLIENVYGGALPDGIDEATFRRGVALGGSTRMDFQRSDAWKNDPRNYLANVDARRAAKAAEVLRKAEAAAAKNAARLAKARATLAALEAASGPESDEDGAEDGAESLDATIVPETDEGAEIVSSDELEEDRKDAADAPTPAKVARRSRRGPLGKSIDPAA